MWLDAVLTEECIFNIWSKNDFYSLLSNDILFLLWNISILLLLFMANTWALIWRVVYTILGRVVSGGGLLPYSTPFITGCTVNLPQTTRPHFYWDDPPPIYVDDGHNNGFLMVHKTDKNMADSNICFKWFYWYQPDTNKIIWNKCWKWIPWLILHQNALL